MSVPTVALNENAPDGGDYKRDGDNEIRTHKKQVREIVGIDHKYDSSGQDADMGKHNKVSLLEQADLGTGAVGKTILGSQTISGKGELVYTDEDNNDVQITSEGGLVGATAVSIIAIIYPVGALYFTEKNENPGTTLGVGTWVAYGAGKVLVGYNASETEFDTIGETGGAKTVTLTGGESGTSAHAHTQKINDSGSGSGNITTYVADQGVMNAGHTTADSTEANADDAHNNLQPYIVAYAWKRTV